MQMPKDQNSRYTLRNEPRLECLLYSSSVHLLAQRGLLKLNLLRLLGECARVAAPSGPAVVDDVALDTVVLTRVMAATHLNFGEYNAGDEGIWPGYGPEESSRSRSMRVHRR